MADVRAFAFVAGFKCAVTNRIDVTRDAPGAPVWQCNHYEHVSLDEKSLDRMREYIFTSPLRWE